MLPDNPSLLRSDPDDDQQDIDSAALLREERVYQWHGTANLDEFFSRVYNYYVEKGFWCSVVKSNLNLLTLAFTIGLSTFLLMFVNWHAIFTNCRDDNTCWRERHALRVQPLRNLGVQDVIVILYLLIFSLYWLWNLFRLIVDTRDALEMRSFYAEKLKITEREVQTMEWAEVVDRLVDVQQTLRLSVVRERLTPHDIASCIMRKENYLIAFINKDLLDLHIPLPIPWINRHMVLTKTLEWNLYFCILNHMFDDHFRLRKEFLSDVNRLRNRFVVMAAINFALMPFILIFMIMYFFLRNAQQFYSQPGTLGARAWSPLARWRFREFNELPHVFAKRLNASFGPSDKYLAQFPSHLTSMLARFVAFVIGAFAAVLIVLGFIDDAMLSSTAFDKPLWWWLAVFGTVVAACRAYALDEHTVLDPDTAMEEVYMHTHFMPRHWRARSASLDVKKEFESLYQYNVVLFLQEILSVFFTPFILFFSLPKSALNIVEFVRNFTVHVDGVGRMCNFALFDFQRHGNMKYGAPHHTHKSMRTRQGKMEKSFLAFRANYPNWEPDADGQRLLSKLQTEEGSGTTASLPPPAPSGATGSSLPRANDYSNNELGPVALRQRLKRSVIGFGAGTPAASAMSTTSMAASTEVRAAIVDAERTYFDWINKYYVEHSGTVTPDDENHVPRIFVTPQAPPSTTTGPSLNPTSSAPAATDSELRSDGAGAMYLPHPHTSSRPLRQFPPQPFKVPTAPPYNPFPLRTLQQPAALNAPPSMEGPVSGVTGNELNPISRP